MSSIGPVASHPVHFSAPPAKSTAGAAPPPPPQAGGAEPNGDQSGKTLNKVV